MKKITSIAATLCMATAFCGFCIGCASDIDSQASENANAVTPVVSADGEASAQPHVILSPGYQQGYGTTANTIATGAEKLTSAQEDMYWVSNAYFATVAAGEDLPTPTTTRTETTFDGWTYAKDGVVVTVEKMPASLTEDLYLYARWKTDGSGGGPVGPVDPDVPTPTASATVNGKTMQKNPSPDNGVTEEYMLTETEFATGDTLAFTVGGKTVTVSALDGASTGLSFANGRVTVANGGTFDLYLKKTNDGWELYGSRAINDDEVSIRGEDAVAGNVYLAGNISGADFSWSSWNDSMKVHKGLKATKSGSSYTLTVKLTQGDNCKFVKYGTASSVWQKSLSGTGKSHITYNGGDMDNMVIKSTGTYTFTITEGSGSLNVSVTYAA